MRPSLTEKLKQVAKPKTTQRDIAGIVGLQDGVAYLADAKMMSVDLIHPNPLQPRQQINTDEANFKELVASIKQNGILNPITVRELKEGYTIIAGERRYKAAMAAGLSQVPVLIRNVDDESASALSLIENLQREDLTAIDEGMTYQRLIEQYDYTEEELGKQIHKSQPYISERLTMIKKLHPEVQKLVSGRAITFASARQIAQLSDLEAQKQLAQKVMNENLTSRAVEQIVRQQNISKRPPKSPKQLIFPAWKTLEKRLEKIASVANANEKIKIEAAIESIREILAEIGISEAKLEAS
ncbi:ParB/RepB/Spo0J family partition protein [Candidatus Poribacteria bacterium]|nr:ParB/RepB/Spo0J family partition protein [Candidatus Poribacteria bacterium]